MLEPHNSIEECQPPPWLHPTVSKFDARHGPQSRQLCHRDIAREYMAFAVHLSARDADKSILERNFFVEDKGGRVRISRKCSPKKSGKEICADNIKSGVGAVANEHTSGLRYGTSTALPGQTGCGEVQGEHQAKKGDDSQAVDANRPKHKMPCSCFKSSCLDVCQKTVEVIAPKSLSSEVGNDRKAKPDIHVNRTETETLINIEVLTKPSRPLPTIPCISGAVSTSVIRQENLRKTDAAHAKRTTSRCRNSTPRKSADEITSIVKECRQIGDNLRTLRWSVLTSLDNLKDELVQFNVIDCLLKAQFYKVLKILHKNRTLYEEACQSCELFKPGKASFHAGFYCNRLAFVSTTKHIDDLRVLMKHDLTAMQTRLFPNDKDQEVRAIFHHIVALLDLVDAIIILRLFVTNIKNAVQQEAQYNLKLLANISASVCLKTKVLAECVGMRIQKGGKGHHNPLRGKTKDDCVHVSDLPLSQHRSIVCDFQPDLSRGAVGAALHLEAHMEASLETARMEPYGDRRGRLAQRDCPIL